MENIMKFDITELIGTVLSLLGIIITVFIIPYIKTKVNKEQYSLISDIVKTAVYFAETKFNDHYGQGKEKFDYVIDYVKEKCEALNITFNETDVTQLIETFWMEMTGAISDYERDSEIANSLENEEAEDEEYKPEISE